MKMFKSVACNKLHKHKLIEETEEEINTYYHIKLLWIKMQVDKTFVKNKRQTLSQLVYECQTLSQLVYECQTLSQLVYKCQTLSQLVYKCQTLSQLVYKCLPKAKKRRSTKKEISIIKSELAWMAYNFLFIMMMVIMIMITMCHCTDRKPVSLLRKRHCATVRTSTLCHHTENNSVPLDRHQHCATADTKHCATAQKQSSSTAQRANSCHFKIKSLCHCTDRNTRYSTLCVFFQFKCY
jgi:hypothetical protein